MKKILDLKLRKGKFLLLESFAVALLPCLPLLDLSSGFYLDWPNHLWMIGYVGAYFREHLSFPVMFNTSESIGIPFPVFYGFGFYRLLGLLSGILTPAVLVRILAFLFFVAQHFCILKTLLKLSLPRGFASSVAWVVTLSIYPLTNLYNRGALTEFFATVALSIALCLFFLTLIETKSSKRLELTLLFTLTFGFSCFTHPITALWGSVFTSVFFIPFIAGFWKELPKKVELLKCGSLSFVLLLLSLSPWIYSNLEFLGQFRVSSITKIWFFPDSIDSFWTRISPIPFDKRTWDHGLNDILTPFLDSQTNLFLVISWISLLTASLKQGKERRSFLTFGALSVGLWLLFFLISVTPELAHKIPVFFRVIQFAYRFVTYQNLAALAGLLGVAWIARVKGGIKLDVQPYRAITRTLVAVALSAFVVKLFHAAAIQTHSDTQVIATQEYRNSTLQLPSNFYGLNAYSTAIHFEPIQKDLLQSSKIIRFQPLGNSEFGMIPPLPVETDQPGWYQTNVQAFPWSRISVNGLIVTNPKYSICKNYYCFTVLLPKGKSQISYSVTSPRVWQLLEKLSIGVNLGLLLVLFLIPWTRRSSMISKDLKPSFSA